MGSKFLSSQDAVDLTELQLGTFPLNVASAVIQSLAPNLPIRTNADRMLTSGLIQVADCAFVPLTNPATTNLNLASYAINNAKEMLLQLNALPTTPAATLLTIYTDGSRLRYKDNTTATYQVATSTDLAAYLLKSGGTMSGAIAMGTNNITGIGTLSGATISRSADNIVANTGTGTAGRVATFASDKVIQDGGTLLSDLATTAAVSTAYLAKAGGTMSGAINMNSQQITNAGAITTANQKVLIGASATSADTLSVTIGDTASTIGANTIAIGNSASATAGAAVVVGSLSVASGVASLASGYFCQATGYQSTALGFGNIASGYSSLLVGTGNRGTANYASVVGHNQINGTANSLIIGDASYANIRTASGICDLGTVAQPFQTIYLNGSIAGTTNTRTVDNIVSNTGASVSGNIASLSGTTGKVITDSGVVAASVVVGPASVVTGRIASYNGTTGKLVADSGVLATDIVIGPASVVTGRIASYNGTTGKLVADSGVLAASVVVGPASVVTGNIASYNGTTGKLVADSGVLAASVVVGPASSTSGALMSFQGITGKIAQDSGIVASTVVTSAVDGGSGNLPVFTGSFKVVTDSGVLAANVVTGPASSVNNNVALFNGTTGKIVQAGAAAIGTLGALTLANTTDSSSVSTGTIICPGGIGVSKNITAGGIIKTTATTASSSTATGAIVCAGGLGVAGAMYVGGKITSTAAAASSGLDLSATDCYANLRVIQNATGVTDNHIYLGFSSGLTSSILLHSNNLRTVTVQGGNLTLSSADGSFGGGTGVMFIANRSVAPSSNPTGGGILYVEAGALKFRGSSGTVTAIAAA